MPSFIPVAEPALIGNEKKYVIDCLDSSWISSQGKYIQQFETAFTQFVGSKYAISCCNGTVALHLALLALGVQPGDEVIVPTLTYVASANAVVYCGAKPVFIDSELQTWNLDPALLEDLITPRTKGIIVVHLYGHPANMDPIMETANKHNLFVIEDTAEAHGAKYKGVNAGTFGNLSVFSFYGNKIITTGEGGMVCTNDEDLAQKVRQYNNQGQDPQRRYWFSVIGYNYRMTNIEAAIGLAQLENADWHISRRREIAGWYQNFLKSMPEIQFSPEAAWAESVYWLNSVLIPEKWERDEVMKRMLSAGVETRPFFYPMHILPPYQTQREFPVANRLAKTGISLPSSALLKIEQVEYVVETLKAAMI